tara:strand:+ start:356 stop:1438 length:1083 start_codon:yes stop_codon:yes gene_type:complete
MKKILIIITLCVIVFLGLSIFKKINSNQDSKTSKAYRTEKNDSLAITDLEERKIPIIDVHEHVQTIDDAERLLKAMDKFNIQKTCLMGTSHYTFTLNEKYGFERFKENNETIINIKKSFPNRFCAFITIDPLEENNLDLIKDYVSRGADGLKLYLGHGAGTGKGPFHSMSLDDERMLPIYEWAEKEQFPILYHINLIKYYDEFIRVLDLYPNLRVCLPHFGLHSRTEERLDRLSSIFEKYPNIYTDYSFGHHQFHIEGFEGFSKWRTRSKKFFEKYADRIMYGSDMVIEKTKTEDYIENTLRSYMQLIESREFNFFYKTEHTMWGLDLNEESLKKIYWETPKRFLLIDEDGNLPNRTLIN